MQLLGLAEAALGAVRAAAPNDWAASYDHGSALYEVAWALPVMRRYERLREAYRAFRHAHKTCRQWVPALLRLGDSVYAMTLLRQASGARARSVAATCARTPAAAAHRNDGAWLLLLLLC
jgi:hypothetical protein